GRLPRLQGSVRQSLFSWVNAPWFTSRRWICRTFLCGRLHRQLTIQRRGLVAAQRFEPRTQLRREKLRLLPCCEVAAFIELVVMDEFGKCPLRPTPRGLIEFVGKGAHSNRDGHTHRSEKRELVFPIQTSRGHRRARQPVERDV